MLIKVLLSFSFVFYSFSALGQTGTVLYNAPAKILFTIDGVEQSLNSRTDYIPSTTMECAEADIANNYSAHEFFESSVKVMTPPKYLFYIFSGLSTDARNIEVIYHTCIGY